MELRYHSVHPVLSCRAGIELRIRVAMCPFKDVQLYRMGFHLILVLLDCLKIKGLSARASQVLIPIRGK